MARRWLSSLEIDADQEISFKPPISTRRWWIIQKVNVNSDNSSQTLATTLLRRRQSCSIVLLMPLLPSNEPFNYQVADEQVFHSLCTLIYETWRTLPSSLLSSFDCWRETSQSGRNFFHNANLVWKMTRMTRFNIKNSAITFYSASFINTPLVSPYVDRPYVASISDLTPPPPPQHLLGEATTESVWCNNKKWTIIKSKIGSEFD